MASILRFRGGSYWDYWFAEDEVVRVKIVSQMVPLVAVLVMVTLSFLVGLVGTMIGLATFLVVYWRIGKTALKHRNLLEGKSLEELGKSRIIDRRVPYSEVERAELRSGKLTIFYGQRKILVRIPPGSLQPLEALLVPKLGEKFVQVTT